MEVNLLKDRINKIIQRANISKSKFAERLNISQAFVSQMCSGVREPSDRTIVDICREFRIREEWLRTGEGEMEIVDTEREKLQRFFADVLATAPDERSALISALADLPYDFWPLAAAMIQNYAKNYNYGTKKED